VLLGVRRDIVRLFRAASLLVLPSRNESFGNVVLEALACGIPFVAGPTGVVRTLDLGATAGRVVDPADPASIASAIEEILVAPDLAAALGARGRELALRFDFEAVGREHLAVYNTMLEERKHERTNRE
jgi:glycosyltransferase involved in cell wall biosynthesis